MIKNKTITSIAIQGIRGAFHEIAANKIFKSKEINIVCCDSFSDIFESLRKGSADYGIMAIENSVAGSILPNYNLLRNSDYKIIGETYLRIEQNLMTLEGLSIKDIKEVHSHPMAILQCREFFKQYPHIKLIESIDTAFSAKEINDKKIKNIGAIASNLAAKLYNLEIIGKGIETNKKNFTRFLIISNKGVKQSIKKINKSSLCFTLPNEKGSLSQVLSVLAFYNINLTKIQSLPIVGKEWEYLFYIDLVFTNYLKYEQSLNAIKPLTNMLEILGEYKDGKK